MVAGDKTRLRQAVLNVLVNAYKYSPPGTVVRVSLGARRHGSTQQLGLRVADNGVGMSAEDVLRVCERFYRADRSGPQSGTGLGMSIVKEIMTLHGGAVEIDSTLGSGTTVTLWLPAATTSLANEEVLPPCSAS
jgi:signal transduction histidine kinase